MPSHIDCGNNTDRRAATILVMPRPICSKNTFYAQTLPYADFFWDITLVIHREYQYTLRSHLLISTARSYSKVLSKISSTNGLIHNMHFHVDVELSATTEPKTLRTPINCSF